MQMLRALRAKEQRQRKTVFGASMVMNRRASWVPGLRNLPWTYIGGCTPNTEISKE